MEAITKDFIMLAHKALERAYYNETNQMTNLDSETAKQIGTALQMVGDLIRL